MKLYVLLCVFFATSVLSAQPESGMPSEPGKCYAKCLINSKYEIETDMEYVYTGSDFSIDGIEEYVYETGGTIKWMKKRADKNCRSANPEDCKVWCLSETPINKEVFYIVIDTSLVKDFVELPFDYEVRIEKGGYTEWREIVCAVDVTEDFYRDVQKVLIANSYYHADEADGQLSAASKNALVQYQKDYELPIGALDYETLEHMGVDY